MAFENDEYDENTEHEFDWSVYGDHEQDSQTLDGKDIIAILIASLQTIFLPLVILAVAMFVIGLTIGLFFG